MERGNWNDLVVENRATPRPISDPDFREWMGDRRIFVSSAMDEEMLPARQAVRKRIISLGGNPEMWEELAPRDQHPERAYLEGVDRSDIFVLLLGHSYGISDDTGFSPTHKENNRAQELHVTRLLFQPSGVSRAERDGKLNRLVDSLYSEVAGGKYQTPEDLTDILERQLRAIASAQESPWVKLGNLVFPAAVQRHTIGDHTTITLTAQVRHHAVRHGIAHISLDQPRNLTLTWGVTTLPVHVDDINIESKTVSEDRISIVCHPTNSHGYGARWGLMGVTIQDGDRTLTPEDQARTWIDSAIFNRSNTSNSQSILNRFQVPAAPTLPEVLTQVGAQGWLAEGITRLYLVEKVTSQFGATFDYLQVGPASAKGVRVQFVCWLQDHQTSRISMNGTVPSI